MQALAHIEHQPIESAQKADGKVRISRKLRQAIDLLASGECKTQKAAAERAGLSTEHLCRMLGQPHIRAVLRERATRILATAQVRASARVVELMDGSSEKVSMEASAFVLALEGIRPSPAAAITINNNGPAGYVIHLGRSDDDEVKPIIDVTSNPR